MLRCSKIHADKFRYFFWSKNVMHPQGWTTLVDRNVVNVAMNYRLGLFGWLASQDIKNDGDLNVGMCIDSTSIANEF